MELLLEFIFEIIVEGSLELSTSRRVPMPLRILALLVFVFIYCAFVGILAVIAIDCWNSGDRAAAIFIGIVDVGIALLVVYAIRKKYREKRNERECIKKDEIESGDKGK